jgi:hypothetical protein
VDKCILPRCSMSLFPWEYEPEELARKVTYLTNCYITIEVKECVGLHLHSPIRLHDVVFSLKKAQGQLYSLYPKSDMFSVLQHALRFITVTTQARYSIFSVVSSIQFTSTQHIYSRHFNNIFHLRFVVRNGLVMGDRVLQANMY